MSDGDVDRALLCYGQALAQLSEGHLVTMIANLILAEHQLALVSTTNSLANRVAEVRANLESETAELMEIQRLIKEARAQLQEGTP